LLEPFIDTVVICTMTALVIIITGSTSSGETGVALTSLAFGSAISWFPLLLALAVVLFAFSTMLSWFYYGFKAWTYLFGTGSGIVFKVFFLACVVAGASMNLGPVIDFSDSMIFIMALPNVIGLYFLMPVVKREVQKYQAKLASGEIRKLR
jgi:AGCS family alanine or glycine:cation symporter